MMDVPESLLADLLSALLLQAKTRQAITNTVDILFISYLLSSGKNTGHWVFDRSSQPLSLKNELLFPGI